MATRSLVVSTAAQLRESPQRVLVLGLELELGLATWHGLEGQIFSIAVLSWASTLLFAGSLQLFNDSLLRIIGKLFNQSHKARKSVQ